jgi:hypothetical protein
MGRNPNTKRNGTQAKRNGGKEGRREGDKERGREGRRGPTYLYLLAAGEPE